MVHVLQFRILFVILNIRLFLFLYHLFEFSLDEVDCLHLEVNFNKAAYPTTNILKTLLIVSHHFLIFRLPAWSLVNTALALLKFIRILVKQIVLGATIQRAWDHWRSFLLNFKELLKYWLLLPNFKKLIPWA